MTQEHAPQAGTNFEIESHAIGIDLRSSMGTTRMVEASDLTEKAMTRRSKKTTKRPLMRLRLEDARSSISRGSGASVKWKTTWMRLWSRAMIEDGELAVKEETTETGRGLKE